MPQPFYSFSDKRTGKTYQMPWADVAKTPTPDDLFNFVNEQNNRSTWQRLNEPLTDLPSRVGRTIAEPLYRFGEYGGQEGQPKPAGGYQDSYLRKAARLGGGFIEGLGDEVSNMTSPIGALATFGGPAAKGLGAVGAPTAARYLGRATQAVGLGQMGHGAKLGYEALNEGDLSKAGQAAFEVGGGYLGAKYGGYNPKPVPKPSINPGYLEGEFTGPWAQGEIMPEGLATRPPQAPTGLSRFGARPNPYTPPPGPPGLPSFGQRALPPSSLERGLPPARGGTPPTPPEGPFYGGRAATSTNINDVIDISPRARTPSEDAFFNQIPDRYKPQSSLSNISEEGLTGQAPYPYVGEAARAEQGFAQPGPPTRLTPGQMNQMRTRFKKKPTLTKAEQEAASLKVGNQPMTSKAWETLKELYHSEKGELNLDELLPGIEDTLRGVGASAREVMDKVKGVAGGPIRSAAKKFAGPEFAKDPIEGFLKSGWQSGWAYLDDAGEPGKELKRLLSRSRLDMEREFAQHHLSGGTSEGAQVGRAIWDRHGDEIKGLIKQIEDPMKRDKVQTIVETQLGRRQPAASAFKPGINAIKKFQAATKLSQFVVSNLQSLPANFARGNTGAMLKATMDTLADYKNSIETARKSGALGPLESEILRDVGDAKDSGTKLINKMFGIDKSEEAMRTISALGGRSTAREIFDQLKANPGNKRARIRLDDLILEDVDTVLKQKELTPQQLDRASARMAEITQGRAETIDLPPLWAGHPVADLATQFKRYGFAQTRNMKEAFKKDPIRTGAAIATAFPLIGEIVGDIKAGVGGTVKGSKETIESGRWSAEDVKKEVINAIQGRGEGLERYGNDLTSSWAFGMLLEMMNAGKRGPAGITEYMAGPTATDVSHAWNATDTAIRKGNNNPLKREIAGKTPYIGTALANAIKSETPTTRGRNRSRFGRRR